MSKAWAHKRCGDAGASRACSMHHAAMVQMTRRNYQQNIGQCLWIHGGYGYTEPLRSHACLRRGLHPCPCTRVHQALVSTSLSRLLTQVESYVDQHLLLGGFGTLDRSILSQHRAGHSGLRCRVFCITASCHGHARLGLGDVKLDLRASKFRRRFWLGQSNPNHSGLAHLTRVQRGGLHHPLNPSIQRLFVPCRRCSGALVTRFEVYLLEPG